MKAEIEERARELGRAAALDVAAGKPPKPCPWSGSTEDTIPGARLARLWAEGFEEIHGPIVEDPA